METFQAGHVVVTVGQRWMYPFENGTDTMLVEILGKGREDYRGGYHPKVKCIQITLSGRDMISGHDWRVGEVVDHTSIGMQNSRWILLEGQDNPNG